MMRYSSLSIYKRQVYKTGIVGKWHLGTAPTFQSTQARGFDYFWGILMGSHHYFESDAPKSELQQTAHQQ